MQAESRLFALAIEELTQYDDRRRLASLSKGRLERGAKRAAHRDLADGNQHGPQPDRPEDHGRPEDGRRESAWGQAAEAMRAHGAATPLSRGRVPPRWRWRLPRDGP